MKGPITLRVNNAVTQARLEDEDRVRVRDDVFHVRPAPDNGWQVTDPSGLTHIVHLAASGDGYWVHLDGHVFLVGIGHAERAPGESSDPLGGLTAPMPATVLSIVAPPGSEVAAGDTVLILEAMKMELPIRAPQGGRVTAVHCSEGQLVQPGVPLAEIA
jgi:acetyl/propionyl-CoA carboxylase alpha subunit